MSHLPPNTESSAGLNHGSRGSGPRSEWKFEIREGPSPRAVRDIRAAALDQSISSRLHEVKPGRGVQRRRAVDLNPAERSTRRPALRNFLSQVALGPGPET